MKNFVKGMDHQRQWFPISQKKFKGKLIDAKLEAGVFTGPEIRSVINDSSFPASLNEMELEAWSSFVNVAKKILGNHKVENHHQLIRNILKSYDRMGCPMSLKMHLLHSHLDFFPANLEVTDIKAIKAISTQI